MISSQDYHFQCVCLSSNDRGTVNVLLQVKDSCGKGVVDVQLDEKSEIKGYVEESKLLHTLTFITLKKSSIVGE